VQGYGPNGAEDARSTAGCRSPRPSSGTLPEAEEPPEEDRPEEDPAAGSALADRYLNGIGSPVHKGPFPLWRDGLVAYPAVERASNPSLWRFERAGALPAGAGVR